ncbi:PREDICTED: muscarinic acetylcholine receptor DM1 isoform X2 [Dinoponera quadriceps]|uniref:Muscarinic acetylcholine receptor DM1 isoform X2 n=1 Tax=Dinoponera quadriceps TaxID=609295 RepID=A0A6P3Y1A2_DINQU|nr:PREDICTED: muscarinic acetylcholine receptor DM1 isoform X2 [Dinoponera quadriceps]
MNVTSTLEFPTNETFHVGNGLDCVEPPEYGLLTRVFIVVFAVILSFITVVGNIMVMVSIRIDKQLQTISNNFLFSLAVADLSIGLISMPLFTMYTVLGYWPLGSHVCDLWLALDYLASNASVLNLLMISFDRYFSVTRPLTYRALRTNCRAAVMIGAAWGFSLLLWPPFIYLWPLIEGQRTVPETACYIQFIETNHYVTFITAIAAFYVPVCVMMILYWRIWKETEKRQKELPNLQAGKQDASKRSNSSDEALDMEESKRPRSESSTGEEASHATHIAVSYIDKHYPQYNGHRPFSWTWLKMWCIAWWQSGRDDEDEDEEIGGPESSRTGPGYEETLTPLSAETPLPSTVSQCPSLSAIQVTGVTLEKGAALHDYRRSARPADLATKTITSDSVYTILIKLPSNGGKYSEGASIKMIHDDSMSIQIHSMMEDSEDDSGVGGGISVGGGGGAAGKVFRLGGASPSTVMRRPSQMPDIRIPLNAKSIPKVDKAVLNKKKAEKKAEKKSEKKSEKKAAKTLMAILLAFIMTWTPYNILVLVKPLISCQYSIPRELWDMSYYLCYINSTVNPMCYALCNAAFRRTYVRILKCKWRSRYRAAVDRGY